MNIENTVNKERLETIHDIELTVEPQLLSNKDLQTLNPIVSAILKQMAQDKANLIKEGAQDKRDLSI